MALPIRTHVVRDWHGNHRLVLVRDQGNRKVEVLAGFEWVIHEEGAMFDPSDGVGGADELIQGIMNEAWRVGFRPAGYADVKNETDALRAHRDDLRTIAFHQLGIAK
jgi:hypothetical protein